MKVVRHRIDINMFLNMMFVESTIALSKTFTNVLLVKVNSKSQDSKGSGQCLAVGHTATDKL